MHRRYPSLSASPLLPLDSRELTDSSQCAQEGERTHPEEEAERVIVIMRDVQCQVDRETMMNLLL